MHYWDKSIQYRCTYTSHTDISICIIGIDLYHKGVPIPHIQIDLSALLGYIYPIHVYTYTIQTDRSICIIGIDLSHLGVTLPQIRIDLSALSG